EPGAVPGRDQGASRRIDGDGRGEPGPERGGGAPGLAGVVAVAELDVPAVVVRHVDAVLPRAVGAERVIDGHIDARPDPVVRVTRWLGREVPVREVVERGPGPGWVAQPGGGGCVIRVDVVGDVLREFERHIEDARRRISVLVAGAPKVNDPDSPAAVSPAA